MLSVTVAVKLKSLSGKPFFFQRQIHYKTEILHALKDKGLFSESEPLFIWLSRNEFSFCVNVSEIGMIRNYLFYDVAVKD